jgi:hypothetical protein
MNNFLDAVGAMLYIVFSLATLPLWLLAHLIIWVFLGARYAKAYRHSFRRSKLRKKSLPYGYGQQGMELALER